jgi:hypothetical protein
VFHLAHKQFRHFGYDRKIFRTLVAAGLNVGETVDEGFHHLTVQEAAEGSGHKQWMDDVRDALKTPPSLFSLAMQTIIHERVIVYEDEASIF